MSTGAAPSDLDNHADLAARIEAATALNRLSRAPGASSEGRRPASTRRRPDRLAARVKREPTRERGREVGGGSRFFEAAFGRRPRGAVMEDGAFMDIFHDLPVTGSANPLSIGLRIRQDGTRRSAS